MLTDLRLGSIVQLALQLLQVAKLAACHVACEVAQKRTYLFHPS